MSLNLLNMPATSAPAGGTAGKARVQESFTDSAADFRHSLAQESRRSATAGEGTQQVDSAQASTGSEKPASSNGTEPPADKTAASDTKDTAGAAAEEAQSETSPDGDSDPSNAAIVASAVPSQLAPSAQPGASASASPLVAQQASVPSPVLSPLNRGLSSASLKGTLNMNGLAAEVGSEPHLDPVSKLLSAGADKATTAIGASPAAKPGAGLAATPDLAPVGLTLTAALQNRFKGLKLDAALTEGAKQADLAVALAGAQAPGTDGSAMIQPATGLATLTGVEAAGRLQVPVNVTFGQPQWATAVAERSALLFAQNIDTAELQLDPPELGRVNVQIQVHHNDQASVTFTSSNANVRDALDQSAQRLRDMLAEQGVDLVNVDISDHQSTQHEDAETSEAALSTAGEPELEGDLAAAPSASVQMNWGVDQYV